MISESRPNWQRIVWQDTPIYVQPDRPDWFVPNSAADQALLEYLSTGNAPASIRGLLQRISSPEEKPYQSRSELLSLHGLKECWLHMTNKCNMQCGHCMFKASPEARDTLSQNQCDNIIAEAQALGSRLFFFTGGEPLVSPAFVKSLQHSVSLPDTHAVVLTNLSLLSRVKDALQDLPRERVHFQVSVDGLQKSHDALRGPHAFQDLLKNLGVLRELGFPVTLAMTVTRLNVVEMPGLVALAQQLLIPNLHFLWLFKKGKADTTFFVEPDLIFKHLISAQEKAEVAGLAIDNIEMVRSQVFSLPGTRYDLSNAGWQSLAVGPDGQVYPTPALVYTKDMQCGHISRGIERVWKDSPTLNKVRSASLNQSTACKKNPFRYLTGGGDMDHCYIHCGEFTGGDPYAELYNNIAQWLIAREANVHHPGDHPPALRLKMGEKLPSCPAEGGAVYFTHSNCVLSLPGHDTYTQINRFYATAAEEVKEDILNPVCYDSSLVQHIPEEMRNRSYGCGSPVLEAGIKEGEIIVDLGSGTGIECFIAAKLTGPRGKVIGIDMGDAMLGLAHKAKARVAENMGFDNVAFKKSYLESLPLGDSYADAVISNCVINLSPDKRRVFQEIMRVLKPGGRLIISDITYDTDIPLDIKYNERLRGECIGGALRYPDLFGLLNDVGLSNSTILKAYLYRTIEGFDFYAITYCAEKPAAGKYPVLYGFPDFKEVMAAVETEPSCSCCAPPEKAPLKIQTPLRQPHSAGCMVCGAALVYPQAAEAISCYYCGHSAAVHARCANGHFVCDACHSADGIEIIKQVCLTSPERDAVALMQTIRAHPRFPVHGPEHHSLVPAVILAALRNEGAAVTEKQILTAIQRGQSVAGGACAFLGACGAAIGVGIAFAVVLGANPYDGVTWQLVQKVTRSVLEDIAAFAAPRCCQRDSWLALRKASKLLHELLDISLSTEIPLACNQFPKNRECIKEECPLYLKN